MASVEDGKILPDEVAKANNEAFDRIRGLVDGLGVVVKQESVLLGDEAEPLLKETPLIKSVFQGESG